MNPQIRTALERILAPVDAAWEKSIVDAYVAAAHAQMKHWAEYVTAPEPTSWRNREHVPQYVLWTHPVEYVENYRPVTHAVYQERHAAGQYSADIKEAIKEGKHQYNLIREAFLLRVGETIDNVIQTKHAMIIGEIRFSRRIEGYITITTKPDTFFRLKVLVKTNYRYGHNSVNGHLTVYGQYPVLFDRAQVNGEEVNGRTSEALLANLISGIPVDHKIRATQAEKDGRKALRIEKQRLDRVRETYSRIAEHYRSIAYYSRCLEEPQGRDEDHLRSMSTDHRIEITKLCAEIGITDPGSKRAANLLRKETIACIKELGNTRTAKV